MRRIRTIISLAMLMTMLASLLGCAQPEGSTAGPAEDAGSADQAGAAKTAADDVVTLSMYVNETWFNRTWQYGLPTNRDTYITDKTGVKLEITSPAGATTSDEKLNAMIASNDLPDMIINSRNYASFFSLPSTGKLLDIVELLDKYDPEGRKLLPDSHINFWKQDDGKLYAWMNWFWAKEQMTDENYINSNAGFAGRGDLMEQLGIKPEDFIKPDDFYNALKKVKDANLQVEGGTVIPFAYTWNMLIDGYGVNLEGPDGKLRVTQKDPKTLEWLLFLNKLWNEKLIYADQMTMTEDVLVELLSQGRLFSAMVNIDNIINRVVTNFERDGKPYTLVPLEPPGAADGTRGHFESQGSAGWLGTSITTSCKDPEKAIKFLSYFHSEEGQLVSNLGIENVTWKWVDGKAVPLDEYVALQRDDPEKATELYGDQFWIGYESTFMQRISAPPSTPGTIANEAFHRFSTKYTFDELAIWNTRPMANTDEAVIETSTNEIWNMYVPQIITAPNAEAATALYQTAIAELDAAGIEQLMAFRDELFQKNKQKLGIEYYYPNNMK